MSNYAPINPTPDETWGKNIVRMLTKHLRSMLKIYQTRLAHKQEVASKHRPGTPHHTRAMRDADEARERIEKIKTELKRRK